MTLSRENIQNAIEQLVKGSSLTGAPDFISLLSGKSGLVLMYAYLYQEFEKEIYFERFSRLLDECIDMLAATPGNATLSNGFGGLMWLIQHLINTGLLDKENEVLLDEPAAHLATAFAVDTETKNYDLLHGLMGKGLYFIESIHKPHSRQTLSQIVRCLHDWSVIQPTGMTWIDYDFRQPIPHSQPIVYNLGMAHGVPSIISFLSHLYLLGIEQKTIRPMLEQSVRWLLTQENKDNSSWFSPLAGTGSESRLAWCYGDLGPALALLRASQALGRADWFEKALAIALNTTRRDITSAGVHQDQATSCLDTGFCHGTSGLSHIFYRFYEQTGETDFLRISDYWLAETVIGKEEQSSPLLYPQYHPDTNHIHWQTDQSLLTGDAGNIMVLLSRLNPSHAHWDIIFMTHTVSV